jgi:hypothetical protein
MKCVTTLALGLVMLLASPDLTTKHGASLQDSDTINIDPAKPSRQMHVTGVANVLPTKPGYYVEYEFNTQAKGTNWAMIEVTYKLKGSASGWILAEIDGKVVGYDKPNQRKSSLRFSHSNIGIPPGRHVLRLTMIGLESYSTEHFQMPRWSPVGVRHLKNSVGNGRNVALFADRSPRFFYATHELGPIFSAAAGEPWQWFPDHTLVLGPMENQASQAEPSELSLNRIKVDIWDGLGLISMNWVQATSIVDQRRIGVTAQDVIFADIRLANTTAAPLHHRIVVNGDCRSSFDWRSKPAGKKNVKQEGNTVVLTDANVYPAVFKDGLSYAIGGNLIPKEIKTDPVGTYAMTYELEIPAKEERRILLACAIHPDAKQAQAHLGDVLKQSDPIADNRKVWEQFYEQSIPRFECSNRSLNELYAFRWFLLRFSTAGGNLGYFKHPVVMEGRQAYQTYCCYSAPFMAYDLNWATDAGYGFGHIANMIHAQYEDGRFPWYTSPRTNRVPLHHASASGLSLMPHAAWKHYLVHGDKKQLAELYPGMKKNMQWWIKDRDPDGDGLFLIDDQLETGMDDLFRWSGKDKPKRYEAIDASCYAYLNLLAVSRMAGEMGHAGEERYFREYAAKTRQAINRDFWDAQGRCWKDRHPQTKALADYVCITTFYPLFANVAEKEQMSIVHDYLLNPDRFWLPYPVPALPKDHPQFNPNGFWQGPSWPAATSHVVEGFATTAKRLDRSLLPQTGQLFLRAAKVHMTPRADFYERYNPLTGEPLSTFRDYMHSWWIDNIIRHSAGVMLEDDGRLIIDPLPMGLEYFRLEGAKWRGKRLDVLWRDPDKKEGPPTIDPGLTVIVDGKKMVEDAKFKPGNKPVILEKQ